jgi:hypothetical protein
MNLNTHTFHGLPVTTGDILCSRDGEENSLFGRIWRLLGLLVPGEIDHCIIYLGPGGRCIESAARGVVEFEMPGQIWDAQALARQRLILDTFYGVAYPLEGRCLSGDQEQQVRLAVASYCREQARHSKPYNLNYFDPWQEGAFYCSQLVYKAYLAQGIDLHTNQDVPAGLLAPVVLPQEIWNACAHLRADSLPSVD